LCESSKISPSRAEDASQNSDCFYEKLDPKDLTVMRCILMGLIAGLTWGGWAAENFPQVAISNGQIRARLYLPDPQQGYYRGTRFDWAGVIASLEYQGHNYFGPWFELPDPLIHDSICGPVEEFRNQDTALGYDQARPGENFIKIGVGALRKPEEERFR